LRRTRRSAAYPQHETEDIRKGYFCHINAQHYYILCAQYLWLMISRFDDVMCIPQRQGDGALFTRPFLSLCVGGAGLGPARLLLISASNFNNTISLGVVCL
jgi:hypothetical protein